MPRESKDGVVAQAIRDAGFVKLQKGLWVTPEQRDMILTIVEKNLPRIRAIKDRYGETEGKFFDYDGDDSW